MQRGTLEITREDKCIKMKLNVETRNAFISAQTGCKAVLDVRAMLLLAESFPVRDIETGKSHKTVIMKNISTYDVLLVVKCILKRAEVKDSDYLYS